MPDTNTPEAGVRRPMRSRLARPIAMLSAGLVIASGSLLAAAPAQAAVQSVVFDGLNYSLDDSDVAAGASVTGFATPSGQTSLSVPSTVEFDGDSYAVTSVADWAFPGNADGSGLTSVTLPDSITAIGEAAFAGNELTSVALPRELTVIGPQALGNNRLESVTIPDGVLTIDNYAFYQNGMTSLDLGNSVTTLGAFAFATNNLSSVSIPDSVTSIDLGAFAFNRLRDVVLGSSVDTIADAAFSQNFVWDWEPITDPWHIEFTAANATLRSVTFTGSVPTDFAAAGAGGEDFYGSFGPAYNTTVYYPWAFDAAQVADGFTSPSWQGYPSQAIATVSFNMGGVGAAVTAQRIPVGSTADQPGAPTDSAHSFAGWFTDAAATTPFSFGTAITKDTVVYAAWNRLPATLSFNMNGHGTQVLAQNYFIGDRPVPPAVPTTPGFSFVGWYTDAAGTSLFDFGAPLTGPALAFASWSPDAVVPSTANVSFELNGHGTPIAAQTVPLGGTAAAPAEPTATGWTFTGWYTDAALTTRFAFATPVTADLRLHAGWTQDAVAPATATVRFELNGHGTPIAAQTVPLGDTATAPAIPTATGWTFNGWYTDAALTEAFDFDTAIATDLMLHAEWTPDDVEAVTATVSFGLNGHGTPITAQIITVGGTATAPADPAATGWTFTGWYTDAALTKRFDFGTAITADLLLYAGWSQDAVAPPVPEKPLPGEPSPGTAAPVAPANPLASTGAEDPSAPMLAAAVALLLGAALLGSRALGARRRARRG